MIPPPLPITGTLQHTALTLRRIFLRWPAGTVYAALICIGIWRASVQGDPFPALFAGGSIVLLLHVLHRFLRERLENDALEPRGVHPAEMLSMDMVRMLRHVNVVSGADLLRAATDTERGRFILEEMGVERDAFLAACLEEADAQVDVRAFLDYAATRIREWEETRVDAPVILRLLFGHLRSCQKQLQEADLSEEDLEGILHWERFHHRFRLTEAPWSADAIRRNSDLGRSWVAGYTNALDDVTTEISAHASGTGERSVVVHADAIEQVLRILGRSKQKNVLLTGEPGSGKRTLIANLAVALRVEERAAHRSYTRVLQLQTEKLLSGMAQPDVFFLQAIARAQDAGHFILVIRDLAVLLRSQNANLRTILTKCLEAQNISIIGIVDSRDYHAIIRPDAALDSLFERVDVTDATDEETMAVLMAHTFAQSRRGPHVPYKSLRSILDLSHRFLSGSGGMPGTAVDVLDDALALAREQRTGTVREEHVRTVVSRRGKLNVTQVSGDERERLLRLEEVMRQRVIGQDPAVQAVSSALKRARLDIGERKRPIGTFLFLGPTGVGKTQTAKVLAEEYFGSADALIRLDMNEFSHPDAIFGIIGSSGRGDGFLTQKVHDAPFSVILLDEIEKAHVSVLNAFLQILDEGFLRDSGGGKTDFRNTIIIATSNAGALFLRDFLRDHPDAERAAAKEPLLDSILRDRIFSPEFLNRFDATVLFYPLTREDARRVARLMIDDIVRDVQQRRGITVRVEEATLETLLDRGYSAEFGAREMRRTIMETIENYLADYLLRHDVRRGEEILIT